MFSATIFSATLGLSHPWEVTEINFASAENRLDITLAYDPATPIHCPCCGAEGKPAKLEPELWHHQNFFQYSTYLHARVPQIQCHCGLYTVDRPWNRPGSKFALVGAPGLDS